MSNYYPILKFEHEQNILKFVTVIEAMHAYSSIWTYTNVSTGIEQSTPTPTSNATDDVIQSSYQLSDETSVSSEQLKSTHTMYC